MNQTKAHVNWIALNFTDWIPDSPPPAAVDPDLKLRTSDKLFIAVIVLLLCLFWGAIGFFGTRFWFWLHS